MRPIDADQILSAANSEEKLIGKDWDYDALKTSIELAPTLDVAPVIHARWIPVCNTWTHDSHEYGSTVYVCSNCQRHSLFEEPYCHCGAKMDADESTVL